VQDPAQTHGDSGALGVQGLFLTHIDLVRGFIRALVRDRHLADDVLQETFLTVARKAGDFEPGTNFPRWACAIARLKVMEAHRREKGNLLFLSEGPSKPSPPRRRCRSGTSVPIFWMAASPNSRPP
jgi:RNA polymerase sigma factor (sigma-70 family)